MTMRWRMLGIAAAAWLAFGTPAPVPAGEKIDLKVLYAGNPGSDREQDFTGFLKEQFTEAGSTDFRTFKADEAKGYDVVLFDWTSIYAREKDGKLTPRSGPSAAASISMPQAPKISDGFSRPAVLIGAAGGALTMKMSLKINWL
jgi:hypothetical protein